MDSRKLFVACAVLVSVVALTRCGTQGGQGADAGSKKKDASTVTVECYVSDDCGQGDCKDSKCVKCTANSCATGQTCSTTTLKCLGGATGDGGTAPGLDAATAAGLDAAITPCATKDACPQDQVCRIGECQPPDPTGACQTNEECLRGMVCSTGDHVCVTMCYTNADCAKVVTDAGVGQVPHCNQGTNRCEPCIKDEDCNGGHCSAGKCQGGCPACNPVCGANQTCDFATCQCKGNSCATGCSPACASNQTCNLATCQCENNTCTACNPACNAATQDCDLVSCTCKPKPCNNCGGTCSNKQTCNLGTCVCDCVDCNHTCNAPYTCNSTPSVCDCQCPANCGGCSSGVCNTATCTCEEVGQDGGLPAGSCDLSSCGPCPSGQVCWCITGTCAAFGADCWLLLLAGGSGACDVP